MLTALFGALQTGLSIWEHHEKTKYVDKLMALKKDWYDEDNKPPEQRDNAVLDNLEFELCNLASGWAALVSATKAGSL